MSKTLAAICNFLQVVGQLCAMVDLECKTTLIWLIVQLFIGKHFIQKQRQVMCT